MSYILDALRRSQAERERERGQVPGLDAQPVIAEETPPQRRLPPAAWLGLGLSLGLVAALVAVLMQRSAPEAGAGTTVAQGGGGAGKGAGANGAGVNGAGGSGAAAPMPDATGATGVQPPGGMQAPPGAGQGLPVVVSAPPVAPPAPAPQPAPSTTPAPAPGTAPVPGRAPLSPAAQFPAPAPQPGAGTTSAPVTAPPPAPAAPPAAASTRAIPLAELPPDLRRDLPPMTMGGSVWSENAGNRFVIVNGQVMREGESPVPGVVVERIAQKAVILRWRETRIEVGL